MATKGEITRDKVLFWSEYLYNLHFWCIAVQVEAKFGLTTHLPIPALIASNLGAIKAGIGRWVVSPKL